MNEKTVFISYSQKDEAWKNMLLPHLRALEQTGVEMKVREDRRIDVGAAWYPEIREAMSNAAAEELLVAASDENSVTKNSPTPGAICSSNQKRTTKT